jgi:hypothetical protein
MRFQVIILLALTVVLASCRKEPSANDITLPQDPNQAPAKLQELRRLVLEGNEAEKEAARGEILQYVKPGMDKDLVEVWMGTPASEFADAAYIENRIATCKYCCRIPQGKGDQAGKRKLMLITYQDKGDGLRVVRIERVTRGEV